MRSTFHVITVGGLIVAVLATLFLLHPLATTEAETPPAQKPESSGFTSGSGFPDTLGVQLWV